MNILYFMSDAVAVSMVSPVFQLKMIPDQVRNDVILAYARIHFLVSLLGLRAGRLHDLAPAVDFGDQESAEFFRRAADGFRAYAACPPSRFPPWRATIHTSPNGW
jgi:hypothetical protein